MKKLLCVFSLLVLFAACNKENKPVDEGKSTNETAQSNTITAKRYEVKSGIITYEIENNMMQGKMTQILYFDDYGAKESRETITEMKMMGQSIKSHKINFNKDGYMYDLDLEKKTGGKMKGLLPQGMEVDINKLSEEMKKEYNMKKIGTENILGKECDVNSMDYAKMNMKGTVSLWQGLTLKSDIDMGKIKVKTVATKFEENVSVPASKFEVPSDFTIEDMDAKMQEFQKGEK
ncbi:MAG: hypothetical protein C4539_04850 [Ignavibacteriales bacterium]|nr:MAG: hypothetical protein C4539_04850 [Ignavibacteriales bacterium]